jgi:hypothetical protein
MWRPGNFMLSYSVLSGVLIPKQANNPAAAAGIPESKGHPPVCAAFISKQFGTLATEFLLDSGREC